MHMRLFFDMIRPYGHLVAISVFSMLCFTLLGVVPPLIIQRTIDEIIPSADTHGLAMELALLAGVAILRQLSFLSGLRSIHYSSQRTLLDFRRRTFQHVQHLPMEFHDNYQSGKLTASLINDVQKMQTMINQSVNNLMVNGLTIIASLTLMVVLEWRLALIVFALLPIYLIVFLKS